MRRQVAVDFQDIYPFGGYEDQQDNNIKVLVRRWIPYIASNQAIINKIDIFRRLNQSCIINLQEYLQEPDGILLFYEYVPIKMDKWISSITQKFIDNFCRQLLELGEYLAKCQIQTKLSLSNVGMNQNYQPKYFLDLDFIVDNAVDKQVLKQHYKKQIISLFRPYVKSKILSIPHVPQLSISKSKQSNNQMQLYSPRGEYNLIQAKNKIRNDSFNVIGSWEGQKARKGSILSSISHVKTNNWTKRIEQIKTKVRGIHSPDNICFRQEQRSIQTTPKTLAFNIDTKQKGFFNSTTSPKALYSNIFKQLQIQDSIFKKFQQNLTKQLTKPPPMKKNESLKQKEYQQMKSINDDYIKQFFQVLDDQKMTASNLQLAITNKQQTSKNPKINNIVSPIHVIKQKQKTISTELQNRIKTVINKSKTLINKFRSKADHD